MIALTEQLKQYPEFAKAMQVAKDKNIDSAIKFILNRYRLQEEWNSMKYEEQEKFMDFLKDVYSFGFYDGVSFTLNPDKYLEDIKND